MNIADFTEMVKNEYLYNWEDLLCLEQTSDIIENAVRYALTYSEVIKTVEVSTGQIIPEAVSIVKCVPALTHRNEYMIYRDLYQVLDMGLNHLDRLNYSFNTDERRIYLFPPLGAVVSYVKDPALLSIEDLTPKMIQWAKEYAIALINCREGALGSQMVVTFMPFSMNYSEILNYGLRRKQELEDQIKKYRFGLFGISS